LVHDAGELGRGGDRAELELDQEHAGELGPGRRSRGARNSTTPELVTTDTASCPDDASRARWLWRALGCRSGEPSTVASHAAAPSRGVVELGAVSKVGAVSGEAPALCFIARAEP
jgi:hypothetical protein